MTDDPRAATSAPPALVQPSLFDVPLGHHQRIEQEFPRLARFQTFSVDWYRAYREEHLAKYPDSDISTRTNLDMFVSIAEDRAGLSGQQKVA